MSSASSNQKGASAAEASGGEVSQIDFETALKQLITLEKKLRLEMQHNLRDLKLNMTQNKLDNVIRKANRLYQIRSQLGSSKSLFKQEKQVNNKLFFSFDKFSCE